MQSYLYYISLNVVFHFVVIFVVSCCKRFRQSYFRTSEFTVILSVSKNIKIEISKSLKIRSSLKSRDSIALTAIRQNSKTTKSSIFNAQLELLRETTIVDHNDLKTSESTKNIMHNQKFIINTCNKIDFDSHKFEDFEYDLAFWVMSLDFKAFLFKFIAIRMIQKKNHDFFFNWLHALL